jgi:methionine synthase I (cobalamin-dependent)
VLNSDNNPFSRSSTKKPLILDGAMGSLLQQRGYYPDSNIWMTSLNRNSPEIIVEIHKSYIEAGADIITTNTFRTNPVSLETSGINDPAPFVKDDVNLAKHAIDDLLIYIAGSNPPAEDCYQKSRNLSYNKLELNDSIHIDLLMDNSVHFILNEIQSHFDEIKIICNHCLKNKIPYVLSILFDENLNILSGESVEHVLKFTLEHEPLAVGFNCIAPEMLARLTRDIKLPNSWGFYLNCGNGNYSEQNIECAVTPVKYKKIVNNNMRYHPSFIGACCGSNLSHIKTIKELFNE